MRHIVNVMAPPKSLGSRNEPEGKDECYIKDVPCKIETLSGRELDQARTTVAEASHKVEMYADPERPVTRIHFLTGGTIGKRRLNVYHVDDAWRVGGKVTLFCGEATEYGGN